LAGSQQVQRCLAGGVACASCQRCFLKASMTDDHTSRCPSKRPPPPSTPRLFTASTTKPPHPAQHLDIMRCRAGPVIRFPTKMDSSHCVGILLFLSGVISSSRHLISGRRFGSSNGRREGRRETRGLKFSICGEHRPSRRPRSGVTHTPAAGSQPGDLARANRRWRSFHDGLWRTNPAHESPSPRRCAMCFPR
jgi:hypothetical protein